MGSRQKERLGGLFIAMIGAIFTIWTWRSALTEGHFYIRAAILGPTFATIGIGLILCPGSRTERIERGEDISQLSGAALITGRWWGILSISIGSGLINLGALKGWQL
jgi:hypothetical protein